MVKDGTLGQDAAVLETNHRYKEAYTGGKGIFQRGGHHLEDNLSQVAYAYQHKQQSLYQYRRQGKLPRVAHGQAYRLNKKGVQCQSRSQSEGALGDKRHEQRAYDGREGCGGKQRLYGESLFAQGGKNHRHQCQDVNHGDKRGDARYDFGLQTISLLRES